MNETPKNPENSENNTNTVENNTNAPKVPEKKLSAFERYIKGEINFVQFISFKKQAKDGLKGAFGRKGLARKIRLQELGLDW